MVPTVRYVEEKFDEFNRMIFGGELPRVPVRLTRARSYLGQLSSRRRRKLFGGWCYSDFLLSMSVARDREELDIQDTIIHEMIHLHIIVRGLKDTAAHGELFRGMMRDINRRFGRHINVSHRCSEAEKNSDRQVRAHYLCLLRLRTGQTGLIVAMKSAIIPLWDMVAALPGVEGYSWYGSVNPYFNRFRRARTLKYYLVDADILDLELVSALRMERTGDKIIFRKQ